MVPLAVSGYADLGDRPAGGPAGFAAVVPQEGCTPGSGLDGANRVSGLNAAQISAPPLGTALNMTPTPRPRRDRMSNPPYPAVDPVTAHAQRLGAPARLTGATPTPATPPNAALKTTVMTAIPSTKRGPRPLTNNRDQ